MADVGEKPALDLIQLHQLLIVFLKHLFVSIQLKAQGELAEAQPVIK